MTRPLWIMVGLMLVTALVAGFGTVVVTYRSAPCVHALMARSASLSTWTVLERCHHRTP